MTDTPSFLTGLFCDSIRREEGGTFSLVGVFQDQVAVEGFPATFTRLSAFVTIRTYENLFSHIEFEVFSIETGEVVMSLTINSTQDIFKQLQANPELLKSGVTLTAIIEGRNLEFKTPTVLGVRGRFQNDRIIESPTRLNIVRATQLQG